jgi:hypothetical protein
VREVVAHPVLRHACERYPWWKLPTKQQVYYMCEKLRLVRISRALIRARR